FFVGSGTGSTGNCGLAYGCAEGGALTAGWHLVAGTFDGTTAQLYVDGVLTASDTFTAPVSGTGSLYIGRYAGGNGYGWFGGIDEVRYYNRALTSAEISAIFSYTGGPSDTTPPSVPSNVQITGVAPTSISVSWAASNDNVGVVGYQVFRNGTQVGTTAA